MNAFYYVLVALDAGEKRNPAVVMAELGFRWERAEAQPIADQWKFHNLTSYPESLPDYIRLSPA